MKIKFLAGLALCTILTHSLSHATIRRVNNNPGSAAAYSSLTTAISAAVPGDTLYIEGSSLSYPDITINKRLHIYGTGYFLEETIPNPQTQAYIHPASVNTITFGTGSKGSVLQGISLISIEIQDSFVTVQRCRLQSYADFGSNGAVTYGDTLRNNYISGVRSFSYSGAIKNLMVYNNIFTSTSPISFLSPSDGYVINNAFGLISTSTTTLRCQNMVFQNNIMRGTFNTFLPVNVFFNNIVFGTSLGTGTLVGSNNVFVPTNATNVLVDPATASTDGKYKLAAGSPAIVAGTLNGIVVDCGPFGGPAPYVLSGMPAIPSIYQLTVPVQVPSGAPTMNITISAAGH